jgi:hypothetical protein
MESKRPTVRAEGKNVGKKGTVKLLMEFVIKYNCWKGAG